MDSVKERNNSREAQRPMLIEYFQMQIDQLQLGLYRNTQVVQFGLPADDWRLQNLGTIWELRRHGRVYGRYATGGEGMYAAFAFSPWRLR